jgi:hypothetical protein
MVFHLGVLVYCVRSIFNDFGFFGQEGKFLSIGMYNQLVIMTMDVRKFYSSLTADHGSRIEAEL